MIETCPDVNIEILKGVGTMMLTIAGLSIAIGISVTIKRWLFDLSRYVDGGE